MKFDYTIQLPDGRRLRAAAEFPGPLVRTRFQADPELQRFLDPSGSAMEGLMERALQRAALELGGRYSVEITGEPWPAE